jgi:hypothetical protein
VDDGPLLLLLIPLIIKGDWGVVGLKISGRDVDVPSSSSSLDDPWTQKERQWFCHIEQWLIILPVEKIVLDEQVKLVWDNNKVRY